MKFILDDKDFESFSGDVPGQDNTLEIHKLSGGYYGIFDYHDDIVDEVGCFTKAEMKLIWQMLSDIK